ncbi:hypothetical protein COCON_G00019700 [Conger conger]|uniref:Uncharacterized protein n=1 Tax=Conger conger TaxID=82655 RepID=A0A9Q1E476_CONCO|nr:hypothetical protein COCON_G00019700 [Conger conger]
MARRGREPEPSFSMNKLLIFVALALMLQCVMAQDIKGGTKNNTTESSALRMAPAPVLLQLGMTMIPALLYKLL